MVCAFIFFTKVHVKSIDSIFRFLHNFTNFHSFWSIFRHTKELAEHFILSGNLFSENEEEKEEKEDENFQLLYSRFRAQRAQKRAKIVFLDFCGNLSH